MYKMISLCFWVENCESFAFLNVASQLHRVCVSGVGQAYRQFVKILAIFRMPAVLATLVTPWYPL